MVAKLSGRDPSPYPIVLLVDLSPERDCFMGLLAALRVCLALLAPAVLIDAQHPSEFAEEIRPQIWPIGNDVRLID